MKKLNQTQQEILIFLVMLGVVGSMVTCASAMTPFNWGNNCSIVTLDQPVNLTVDCGDQDSIFEWLETGGFGTYIVPNPYEVEIYTSTRIDSLQPGPPQTVEWVLRSEGCDTITVSAVIQLLDTVPPFVVIPPDDITVECTNTQQIEDLLENGGYAYLRDNCCIDTITHSFDGTFNCGGTTIYFTARDCAGNEFIYYMIVYLIDTVTPTIDTADNIVLPCGNNESVIDSLLAVNGGNTAYDCNGDITWSNDFIGNYPSEDGDSVDITFTATDLCGNSSSISQLYTVACDPCQNDTISPTVTEIADPITIQCMDDPAFQAWLDTGVVFEDNCCLDTVTNTFTGDYNCNNGTVIYFTARDCAGNETTIYQEFYLIDTVAPVIVDNQIDLIEIDECDSVQIGQTIDSLVAINAGYTADDCNGNVEWESIQWYKTPDTVEAIFTAKDKCGNSSSVSQLFTLTCDSIIDVDTCKLRWGSLPPEEIFLQCGDTLPAFDITALSCGDSLQVNYSSKETGSCPLVIQRTAQAENGDSVIQFVQRIEITDTIAPTFRTIPDTVRLECDSLFTLYSIIDAIEGDINDCNAFTIERTFTPGSLQCNDTTQVCIRATDACENASEECFFVIINEEDDEDPNDSTACIVNLSVRIDSIQCFGGNGNIRLFGDPSYEYVWDSGERQQEISVEAGTYQVTVTNRDSLCRADTVLQFTLSQPDSLEAEVQVLQDKSCDNPQHDGQATVFGNGGVRPYQYGWSYSLKQDSLVDDLPEGKQEVTITDANGCQVTNDFFLPCDSCKMWVVGDVLYCSFNVPEDQTFDAEVMIMTYTGQEAQTESVPVTNGYGYREVDISSLKATSIYIGQADLNEGRMKVIKFVKQ